MHMPSQEVKEAVVLVIGCVSGSRRSTSLGGNDLIAEYFLDLNGLNIMHLVFAALVSVERLVSLSSTPC